MKTCPKCGAENRQTATECRLCATSLGAAAPPAAARVESPSGEQLPPTQLVSGRMPAVPAAAQKVCPVCQTANEPDWVFCQSCGKKLPDTIQEKPPVQAKPDTAPQNSSPKQEPSAPAPEKVENVVVNADRDTLKDLASRKPVETPAPPPPQPQAVSQPSSESSAAAPSGGLATLQTPVPSAAGVCPKCGATSTPTGFFCANCGAKLAAPTVEEAAVGPGPKHVLQLITEGGQVGEVYPIQGGQTMIGRNDGDVTFPHDGYLSGRHARVVERGGRFYLIDNGSRNGTFVRIKGEIEIEAGDTFLVGKQIFKLEKA